MGLAERGEGGSEGERDSEARYAGPGLRRAMQRLEHELALTAAVIEKKRHPERELAKQVGILAMVIHADRDPRGFAIWCNSLVKR